MKRKLEYESEALKVSHQAAADLYELGIIDADRMKEFDKMCVKETSPSYESSSVQRQPIPAFAATGAK